MLEAFFITTPLSLIDLPAIAILAFCAILFSLLDIKKGEVPRLFSIAMIGLVFISKVFIVFASNYTSQIVLQRLSSSTTAGVFALFTFTIVFLLCRGKMGLADIWFACAMGIVLGLRGFIFATLIACFFALLFYTILFIIKKGKRTSRMSLPFIPFLSLGFFFVVLYIFLQR